MIEQHTQDKNCHAKEILQSHFMYCEWLNNFEETFIAKQTVSHYYFRIFIFSLNLPIILWSVLNDRNNFRCDEKKTTITSCNEIENSSETKNIEISLSHPFDRLLLQLTHTFSNFSSMHFYFQLEWSHICALMQRQNNDNMLEFELIYWK